MTNPEPGPLKGRLEAVCDAIARLRAADPTTQRISVQAGDITVELDWTAAPAVNGHAPPAGVPAADPAASGPAAGSPAAGAPAPAEGAAPPGDQVSICAEAVGTFYRTPEPGAPPFVAEGDVVQPGQQVAFLEAMKMMIPVTAVQAGRVIEILVENSTAVEFGTPLMTLAPAPALAPAS